MNLTTIIPNPEKALFLAQKQLSELVFDAVNLEGVNYTMPEVQTLLDGVTVGGHRLQDETITLNQAAAWQFLFTAIKNQAFCLSQDFVCQLHLIMAKDEALLCGEFRAGGVTIAGTDYVPPDYNKLPELWQQLIPKLSPKTTQNIYTHAISLFLQIARVQFFYDGNKRTGRLIMNGVLLSNGLPVINLPAKRQLEFNQAMLDFYPSGDEKPMQNFMLSCLNPQHIKIMSK